MQIEGLRKFRGRNPRGYFTDLPWEVRQRAYLWLNKFVTRRKARFGYVPRWLFAIYVGQAKRLALNPPTAAWGRSMLAARGGYAAQARFRMQGRNIQAHATRCRVSKRAAIKRMRRPCAPRHSFGNLTGI